MFFWNSLTFSVIQQMLAIWSLVPLPFLNPAWTSGSSWFMYCWSLAWRILSITLLVCVAKSLQSCLTLCDPIDGSPPGSPVPETLQAGTLEWVAISFSNAGKWKMKVKLLRCVWLLATERVTGRKARGLQTEETGCKCLTFLSLLSGRKKQTSDIFSLLYTNLKGGFS